MNTTVTRLCLRTFKGFFTTKSEAAYSPSHISFWPVYGFRRLRSTSWAWLSTPGLAALTNPRQEGAPQLQGSFSMPQNLHMWSYLRQTCSTDCIRDLSSSKPDIFLDLDYSEARYCTILTES